MPSPIVLTPAEQKLFKEALTNRGRLPTELKQSGSSDISSLHIESGLSPELQNTLPPALKSTQVDASFPSSNQKDKYFTLSEAFPNAAVFLMFFDYSLRTGSKALYTWQIEELLRLSERGEWTTDNKLLYYLKANNGSGKDAFIIAGFVCYVLCCWRRYKVIITSSSDNQLDTQTRVYIKDLAESVNAYMRTNWEWDIDAIDIKAESFKATKGFSGTEVYTFVSKEGGKVEGYHPFPDADHKEGCIVIINEAKSIPEEIHQHLKKCTYNMWLEISSTGESSGQFYKETNSESTIHYPQKPEGFRPFCRTITYRDTPHKRREAEEAIKLYGEDDPFVKTTYLSKFTSLGAQVAITEESLDKCIKECRQKIVIGCGKHGGLDFAAGGGDECSFYVFDENTLIGAEYWKVKDTEVTIDILIGRDENLDQGLFQKYGFTKDTIINVTGDDNGLGEPIINSLHRRGWRIGRIKNQSSARRKDRYLNRGAEIYSSLSRIIAGCFINWNGKLLAKTKRQLTTRHYKIEGQGKFKLIPKEEESESPDHADAIALAWSQWTILDFLDDKVKKEQPRTPAPLIPSSTLAKAQISREAIRRFEFSNYNPDAPLTKGGRVRFRNNTPITILRSLYGRS